MPVQVSWHEPDKIIISDFTGEVSVSDLQNGLQEIAQCLNQTSQKAHLIVNWVQVTNTPNIMAVINQATETIRHERMGFVGIVGVNAILSYWMQVFSKIAGLKSTRFESVEDAAAFLKRLG